MSDTPNILSLAHKSRIDEVCKALPKMGLQYFVMYIIFNDSSTFVLSNVYPILESYYQEGLHKEDYTWTPEFINLSARDYYFCEEERALSDRLKSLLAEKYSIYPTYNIIRQSAECTFVFSAIRSVSTESAALFYAQTIKSFEHFCIRFVDDFLDVIKDSNPAYKNAFVLNNKSLRDAVIKQGYEEEISLTAREQECLWIAAEGKSAKEIAKKLNISPFTVEKHLKQIRETFNGNAIPAIIIECINRGIMGRVHHFGVQRKDGGHSDYLTIARPGNFQVA